jgi:H+/Cl- antiporter ClcA
MRYDALIPCLIAAIFADIVCAAWGIHHTHYLIFYHSAKHIDLLLLAKVVAAGVTFGLVSYAFSLSMHTIKKYSKQYIKPGWLIPAIGGCIIIILTWCLGTDAYLGLGVNSNMAFEGISIVDAVSGGYIPRLAWFWKLLFTAITLGMGFKGGEVTPLFFIGATLGVTVAHIIGAPPSLFAGLGFIAVFAGATNTPIACTLMGIELFGTEHALYFAVACFTAYYFSGNSGIYSAQRIAVPKKYIL